MEDEEKKRSGRRGRVSLWQVLLLASVVLLVLLPVSDCISEMACLREVQADMESGEAGNRGGNGDTEAAIREYNQRIAGEQKKRPFHYQGELATDEEYEALPVKGNRQLCYLVIPEIDLCIPVMHGTGGAVLEEAAGHMYGTSLPYGGISTHAVLAAHSGLVRAKLFTDLDRLKKGDSFYLRGLGKTREYRICKIRTVRPEEADACLGVKEGEDLVTLYTCTPRGINSHRLLVIGRYEKELQKKSTALTEESLRAMWKRALAKLCLLLLIPSGTGVFLFRGKALQSGRQCLRREQEYET
uniref:Sortase family protein, LPXTG-site transpeptidase n=1 Tax=Eubacterium cellulosolvens (strain ATCC 43171 / JCM 9499 / 6) TaxID=633697 RepID=I5AW32_EUBC6